MNINKKWLIGSIAIILIILFIWKFFAIIFYVIIASFLSILGAPIVSSLSKFNIGKFKIPRWINSLLALIIVLGLIISFFAIFTPIILSQVNIFSELDINVILENFNDPICKLESFLIEKNIINENESLELIITNQFYNFLNITNVEKIIKSLINITGNFIIAIVTICLSTFFFLKDDRLLYKTIIKFTPDRLQNKMKNVLSSAKKLIIRYLWGLIFDAFIVFIVISISMYFLGVKNALIIGIIAGILNVIPYIGPILSATIGISLGVVNGLYVDPTSVNLIFIIKMLILYIIVNMSDGFILQPIIFGKIVKSHPLEIFLVVLIASQIGGIIGMIVAIPAYSLLRIIANEFLSNWNYIKRLISDTE